MGLLLRVLCLGATFFTCFAVGRMKSRPPRVTGALVSGSVLTAPTEQRYSSRKAAFEVWLGTIFDSLDLDGLSLCPMLLDSVLQEYGSHLYDTGKPLYHFICTLTAVQKRYLFLRHQLPNSWSLVTLWDSCWSQFNIGALCPRVRTAPWSRFASFGDGGGTLVYSFWCSKAFCDQWRGPALFARISSSIETH